MTSDEALARYVDSLFVREPALLVELRETLEEKGFPTIQVPGRTGRVLELLTLLVAPGRILEIGTLGGYSALWMARGLPSGGRILTLEKDPERAAMARSFIERAGESGRIEVRVGDARAVVPELGSDGTYDLVFIDADKESYTFYLEQSARLLRPGGLLLADNALWHGRVVEEDPDEPTRGVQEFNRRLAARGDFRSTILPVGDGVALGVRV